MEEIIIGSARSAWTEVPIEDQNISAFFKISISTIHLMAEWSDSLHEFTVKDIDGEEISLEKYRGHVCVVVNVASF